MAVTVREPRLSAVLDEQEAAAVTEPSPSSRILGKAEEVGEVERPGARIDERVELVLLGLEIRCALVERAPRPRPLERLYLGAVVVGGREHPVPGADSERRGPAPQPVASPGEKAAPGLLEGERQATRRTSQPDAGRQRRPHADAR